MIETNSAYISKVDDNTIKVIFKKDSVLSVEEYATYEEHYYELMGRKGQFKFLVIIEVGSRLKQKVVQFFKGPYKTDFKVAEAFIIKDPIQKMFFKVGKKVLKAKRDYPLEEFDSEEEALSWLKSITSKL